MSVEGERCPLCGVCTANPYIYLFSSRPTTTFSSFHNTSRAIPSFFILPAFYFVVATFREWESVQRDLSMDADRPPFHTDFGRVPSRASASTVYTTSRTHLITAPPNQRTSTWSSGFGRGSRVERQPKQAVGSTPPWRSKIF